MTPSALPSVAQRISELDAPSRECLRTLSTTLGMRDRCLCADPSGASALDLAGDGAVLFDVSRRVVLVTPKAAALLGGCERDLTGRSCAELYGCTTCVARCATCEHRGCYRAIHATAPAERSPVLKRCSPLQDADGRVVGFLESLHDASMLHAALSVRAGPAAAGAPPSRGALDEIVGDAPAIRELRARIASLATCNATVLITGETGVGKELVARGLHDAGPRRDRPFQALNCGALTEGLLESEVFGHERGAFTGAVRQKAGRLELAGDGTLFLDEIGCLPVPLQAKLLRALESREFERVGGERTLRMNARIVAATNADIGVLVGQGRFRADLYYRLNVVPLAVPPLRHRTGDIRAIAAHLLSRVDLPGDLSISNEALAILEAHDWPGNVRELWNVLQHAAALRSGSVIDAASLPQDLRARVCAASAPPDPAAGERCRLERALAETRFNRSRAAERLGMSRTTLWRRMRALQMI